MAEATMEGSESQILQPLASASTSETRPTTADLPIRHGNLAEAAWRATGISSSPATSESAKEEAGDGVRGDAQGSEPGSLDWGLECFFLLEGIGRARIQRRDLFFKLLQSCEMDFAKFLGESRNEVFAPVSVAREREGLNPWHGRGFGQWREDEEANRIRPAECWTVRGRGSGQENPNKEWGPVRVQILHHPITMRVNYFWTVRHSPFLEKKNTSKIKILPLSLRSSTIFKRIRIFDTYSPLNHFQGRFRSQFDGIALSFSSTILKSKTPPSDQIQLIWPSNDTTKQCQSIYMPTRMSVYVTIYGWCKRA